MFVMKKLVMLLVVVGLLFASCRKENFGPQGAPVPENAKKGYALLYKTDLLKAISLGDKLVPYFDEYTGQMALANYGEYYTLKVYIDLGFDSKGRVLQSNEPITVQARVDDILQFRSSALENNMMRTYLGKATFSDGKTIDVIGYIY